ncbi:squalene/phytoene synthase family protein [Alteribacillus sp. HJP-4]|uniref:squalene/phytoene synthase family protein n=1 Tax=Alteribacillus sp. HJP-4 TaxID=2775394 RepID=UPI0035CD066E
MEKNLHKDAMKMLKLTSRTFYIPITLLEPKLKKTVASAYLCMRAMDEIEDHQSLDLRTKYYLLRSASEFLNGPFNNEAYHALLEPYKKELPEVTWRLGDWISLCPDEAVENVKASTSTMADGMAYWAQKNWEIKNREDLDDYTYYVAGLVGVMLSDIWEQIAGNKTNRELAVAYGRGLQAVNMLRNQQEDDERGVSFLPDGWSEQDLFTYAENNLALGEEYMKDLDNRSIILFCKIPLTLAKKTINALKSGREKMSRTEVETTIDEIVNERR